MKKVIARKKEIEDKLFSFSFIILFGIFLVIGIVFYVSLSIVKSGDRPTYTSGGVTLSPDENKDFNFGLGEIIFAIVFGLFMAGFLAWAKSIMVKNSYLGAIIGIIGGAILGYAFYLKYKGPYSTGFMTVTGLVVLTYLGMNFYRYKKENIYVEKED